MKVDIYNTDKKYDIIYTDPAWKQTKGNKRKCRPNQGKELDYKNYCSWLQMTIEKKNELIDALARVRQDEIDYLKQAEHYHEIIRNYEIYEQVEKGGAE